MRTVSIYFLLSIVLAFSSASYALDVGDDGLHKQEWFSLTFKDIAEDISDASAEGKRLVIIFEQKGCIYCKKMHETVLSVPEVRDYIKDNFNVVQMNMYGDDEITDLDGETLTEKEAFKKWNIMFTPMIMFMPQNPDTEKNAGEQAVVSMPGAFGRVTFLHAFMWVNEKGYETDEEFQRYHSRLLSARIEAGKPVDE